MPVNNELRDAVAREIAAEVGRQTNGAWPVWTGGVSLIDAELDLPGIADRILALPEIANALKISHVRPAEVITSYPKMKWPTADVLGLTAKPKVR